MILYHTEYENKFDLGIWLFLKFLPKLGNDWQ